MEISLAPGNSLGERQWIAGLDQHVQPPALDFLALAVSFDDLGVAHSDPPFVLL